MSITSPGVCTIFGHDCFLHNHNHGQIELKNATLPYMVMTAYIIIIMVKLYQKMLPDDAYIIFTEVPSIYGHGGGFTI